ncbi:MAG TPA: hypothetical protein VIL20_15235 [Sandaracinaceae bacterium]
MRRTIFLPFVVMAALLAACSGSHGREHRDGGGGEPCGPTTCAAGEVCCNPSCGICTAPGEGCSLVECVDAGPPLCGSSVCGRGETCCPGCPGSPSFCVSGDACPDITCPPPPRGCESCRPDELCCPTCEGAGHCVRGDSCPPLGCPPPPPGCESCGAGERCCPSCPGLPPFCVSGDTCPEVDCPAPSCDGLSYCDCVDDPACEPLIDRSTGCVCPCDDPFNCTGEPCDCGCGGAQYRGCTEAGRCPVTELHCEAPCTAQRGADGCLVCMCADVGG